MFRYTFLRAIMIHRAVKSKFTPHQGFSACCSRLYNKCILYSIKRHGTFIPCLSFHGRLSGRQIFLICS